MFYFAQTATITSNNRDWLHKMLFKPLQWHLLTYIRNQSPDQWWMKCPTSLGIPLRIITLLKLVNHECILEQKWNLSRLQMPTNLIPTIKRRLWKHAFLLKSFFLIVEIFLWCKFFCQAATFTECLTVRNIEMTMIFIVTQ